jgi:hypothetical protein
LIYLYIFEAKMSRSYKVLDNTLYQDPGESFKNALEAFRSARLRLRRRLVTTAAAAAQPEAGATAEENV